ncbi:MAG: DUF3943 domain-containing protein [Muribaculaceae bacterium]|nr:DUF3943 domain-containing protein [Muribaculaceae bacterium]
MKTIINKSGSLIIYPLLILLFLLFGSEEVLAQMPIKYNMVSQLPPDSLDLEYYGKKNFWRASGEVVGLNLGLWAFDRYVQHGDWSYISLHTIKENFKHGFIWDNDQLGTNTFLHPYNGNLYYNAGRANGYNFWQSELFAIGGSAMWELFMEREYPSTNDIIATPIGGTAIGEPLFRASDAVLDDRTTGWERFGREAAGFILSPIRGLNRIFTGQAWHRRNTTGHIFGKPSFAMQISTGVKMMEFQGRMRNPFVGASVQIDLEYGDRFEAKSTKPYDYFTVKAELQALKYQPMLNQLQIKGRLLSREVLDHKNSSGSIGLYQHFDFYDSDTINSLDDRVPYKLGIPASLGAGFLFRDVERRKYIFDAYFHANVILLGGILSDHYWTDERNYNWGQGFSLKCGINIVWDRKKASFSLMNEYYRLWTWKGYKQGIDLSKEDFHTLNVMGDKSAAYFNVTEARFDYQIWKHLYGTFVFKNQVRHTNYRDFPKSVSSTMDFRLMATYKF